MSNKNGDIVINLYSDADFFTDKIKDIVISVPEEKNFDKSSWIQSEYSRSKKNKKTPKYINISALSNKYHIIKILDAKYNPIQKITKFLLLIEDIDTGREYRVKATNNDLKIYSPEMLCDYYERRMTLDKINYNIHKTK